MKDMKTDDNVEVVALMTKAADEEEQMYADKSPRGDFSPTGLNVLVKATNQMLPLFEQDPTYPTFSEAATELPTDFVRVLAMFSTAIEDAITQDIVEPEMRISLEELTSDQMLRAAAAKISSLVKNKEFKRWITAEVEDEPEMTEEQVEDTIDEDASIAPEMDDEDLFLSRM